MLAHFAISEDAISGFAPVLIVVVNYETGEIFAYILSPETVSVGMSAPEVSSWALSSEMLSWIQSADMESIVIQHGGDAGPGQ